MFIRFCTNRLSVVSYAHTYKFDLRPPEHPDMLIDTYCQRERLYKGDRTPPRRQLHHIIPSIWLQMKQTSICRIVCRKSSFKPPFAVSPCTVGENGNLCWLSAPCSSRALLAPPVSIRSTLVRLSPRPRVTAAWTFGKYGPQNFSCFERQLKFDTLPPHELRCEIPGTFFPATNDLPRGARSCLSIFTT